MATASTSRTTTRSRSGRLSETSAPQSRKRKRRPFESGPSLTLPALIRYDPDDRHHFAPARPQKPVGTHRPPCYPIFRDPTDFSSLPDPDSRGSREPAPVAALAARGARRPDVVSARHPRRPWLVRGP